MFCKWSTSVHFSPNNRLVLQEHAAAIVSFEAEVSALRLRADEAENREAHHAALLHTAQACDTLAVLLGAL